MKFTYASGSRPLDGYTVKRGIGHGGFGEVYYAVSDGGKEVALKLVMRNLDVELRGVAQCMNLKHPNLVTLYDLRTNEAGEHWVVMEYVSGQSLSEILDAHPNGFNLEDANRWLQGICSGIGYLHDRGIVHRDLKPGNVFIEDATVKIGDYGLTKFITASRRSGQTESVGTVHYMAPEISRGKYDREIDVYAAGVILFEMITGHVPFDGESVGEILMKHLTAQPDVSKLPAPYNRVVARALAKDPVDRFRTMEQLAASVSSDAREAASNHHKETLLHPPSGVPNPAPPPGTAVRDPFGRLQGKFVAWFNRAWGVPDYVLAILALLFIGATGTTLLRTMTPVVVPGLVICGVVLLIVKASGRHPKFHSVGAAPAASAPPVILNAAVPPAAATPGRTETPMQVLAPAPVVRTIVPRPYIPPERPKKPARTRLAEAASAMLLTTVMSVIASVFAAGLMGLEKPAEFALLTSTCLAGCWLVVIPAKIWEGQVHGDATIRRLIMAALGIAIGMWCSYLDKLLQVGWMSDVEGVPIFFEPLDWMPGALKNATYFGLVFLLPRWWSLAESRRGVRFNPWLVIVPCFWAWLIARFWSPTFSDPSYWGVVVTGLVAAMIQLATPWEDPAARRRVIV